MENRMTLPRKVREQEQQVEALMKQAYGPEQPAPAEETPKPSLQVVRPLEETPAQPAPAAEATQPAPAPEQQPAQQPEDTWEHRYKVLNGKYSAEVPRLAAQLREINAKLDAKDKEIEALKNAKPPERLVSDEEVEEYGEKFVDVVRRTAREELRTKEAEIEQLRRELAVIRETAAKSAEVDYYSTLASKVPDWVLVNQDQDFHRWLSESDELTGIERQQLLEAAEKDRDPIRVANFFVAYKRQAKQREVAATQSLESQVVPQTRSAATAPDGRKYWTRAEINRFYEAVRRNEIPDAEAARLEADITAALVEGRIR